MKHIGTTQHGTFIIEATPCEWKEYLVSNTSYSTANIGNTIKEWRKANSISQKQLANKVGISRNYLSQVERGEATNISLAIYLRLIEIIDQE